MKISSDVKPLQSEGGGDTVDKKITNHEKEVIIFMIETLEGGWKTHHDTNDVGGKTRAGIASRYYPNLDLEAMSKDDIVNFYSEEWYSKVKNISWEGLRDFVFCTGLNTGLRPIIRILQMTLNQLDPNAAKISDDGIYGPNTDRKLKNTCLGLRAANPQNWSTYFWDRYMINIFQYYSIRGTAKHHFLGWYNRINRTLNFLLNHSNMSDDFLVERGMKK